MKLTLRNVLVCCGAFLGLVAFILAATCGISFKSGDNVTLNATVVFGKGGDYGAAVFPLIGAILLIVGVLCAAVVGLFGDKFLKDANVKKIVIIVAAALIVFGSVTLFFIKDAHAAAVSKASQGSLLPMTKEDVLSLWSHYQVEFAGLIIAAILGILGGSSICLSQFVADKKLGK